MDGKCQACPSSYGLRICFKCHVKLCRCCHESHISENKGHLFEFPLTYSCTTRCKIHPRCYFTGYCTECRTLICDDCLDGQHRNHKAESIFVARDIATNRIRFNIEVIQDKQNAIETIIRKYQDQAREFEASVQSVITEINRMTGTCLSGLVYDLKSETLTELKSLTEGKHKNIEHVLNKINHIKDVKYMLEGLRKETELMQRRFEGSYDDVITLERWSQFERLWEEGVIIPEIREISFPAMQITYHKPSADEIKSIMFRINVGENPLACNSEEMAALASTSDPSRNFRPGLRQNAAKLQGDDMIKILQEATSVMSENIKALRAGCEKGLDRINLHQLPIQYDHENTSKTVLEQQKHILEIFLLYKSQNHILSNTEERLERARESLRQQGKERSLDTTGSSTQQRELEIIRLEKTDLQNRLEKCEQNYTAACEELSKSRQEVEQLKRDNYGLRDRFQIIDTSRDLEFELKAMTASKAELERRLADAHKEVIRVNTELKTKTNENEALKNRLQNIGESMSLRQQLESTKTLLDELEERFRASQLETYQVKKDLDKKRQDNEDLKNRLSQVAGAKLMTGNASIADLGDKFRPTRIAEMYSEMYDNEWTEAIDELSSGQRSEDLIAQYLFVTLQACYKTCSQLASEQMEALVKTMFYRVPHEQAYLKCHMTEIKQIKDARRGIAIDVAKETVKEIAEMDTFIVEFRRLGAFDDDLVNQIIQHPYFAKCTLVCWLMVVQDPPMVFDEAIQEGSKLDKDMYRPYTRSGNRILFSVWPAMFLHQNGPLLVKGVVQCTH